MTSFAVNDRNFARPKGRFLRMRDLVAELKLSESTINRLHRRGEFPAKIQLSPNCTGWWECEVEAWKESRTRTSGHH
ncbi:hypothetical protein A7X12_18030 [Sphingomonas sp. TDK1]|nr:hypothetical protein A7X12_18030 [Sphingomonas sp. TDK1]